MSECHYVVNFNGQQIGFRAANTVFASNFTDYNNPSMKYNT